MIKKIKETFINPKLGVLTLFALLYVSLEALILISFYIDLTNHNLWWLADIVIEVIWFMGLRYLIVLIKNYQKYSQSKRNKKL